MRAAFLIVALAACHSSQQPLGDDAGHDNRVDGAVTVDASVGSDGAGSGSGSDIDAMPMSDGRTPLAGFGTLSGTGCGTISAADLVAGSDPKLFHVTFDFAREYMDPADRTLLTTGGQTMAATPNAGGTSGFSEMFSFEELDRCDGATLLKTETEIDYTDGSKKTDLEVSIAGVKIGVSVTRAFTYNAAGPDVTPYTLQQATDLLNRKLGDIVKSSAGVLPEDKWAKQFLSLHAVDATAAGFIEQAWATIDPAVKVDTDLILIETDGADTFIYTNQ